MEFLGSQRRPLRRILYCRALSCSCQCHEGMRIMPAHDKAPGEAAVCIYTCGKDTNVRTQNKIFHPPALLSAEYRLYTKMCRKAHRCTRCQSSRGQMPP